MILLYWRDIIIRGSVYLVHSIAVGEYESYTVCSRPFWCIPDRCNLEFVGRAWVVNVGRCFHDGREWGEGWLRSWTSGTGLLRFK